MMDYEGVAASTLFGDRPGVRAGETYFSVLVAEGAELKRCDYAADAWQGPPEEAIGWWKSQVPERNAGKKHWAPNDVMLDFWDQLADEVEKQDMRYVLTLLLVRRRVFRLEEEKRTRKDGSGFRCIVPAARPRMKCRPSPEQTRIDQIQEELAALLK